MIWSYGFHRWSSPRPWGCFPASVSMVNRKKVFPTPVGVFLWWGGPRSTNARLPHARGGVSQFSRSHRYRAASSPRPWGCFSRRTPSHSKRTVFPTPVGVFLYSTWSVPSAGCLPHARGGVSASELREQADILSSPRPWGCFPVVFAIGQQGQVFPTPVGVFPLVWGNPGVAKRLPHARGGVSFFARVVGLMALSSPRPWGCFLDRAFEQDDEDVFPTPVGVFPAHRGKSGGCTGLPHARGGVSTLEGGHIVTPGSSPRPWGCFRHGRLVG